MNERDELVAHLRKTPGWPTLGNKAAAQIERDGREIEMLREALEQFATEENWLLEGPFDVNSVTFYGESFARAALNPEKHK